MEQSFFLPLAWLPTLCIGYVLVLLTALCNRKKVRPEHPRPQVKGLKSPRPPLQAASPEKSPPTAKSPDKTTSIKSPTKQPIDTTQATTGGTQPETDKSGTSAGPTTLMIREEKSLQLMSEIKSRSPKSPSRRDQSNKYNNEIFNDAMLTSLRFQPQSLVLLSTKSEKTTKPPQPKTADLPLSTDQSPWKSTDRTPLPLQEHSQRNVSNRANEPQVDAEQPVPPACHDHHQQDTLMDVENVPEI